MSYTKHNFQSGEKLYASQLNNMDDQIALNDERLSDIEGQGLATIVDDWLEENISNPDSPPLDRTLTSSSAAAPADLVGEELANLKQDFSDIAERTSNRFNVDAITENQYIAQDGTVTASNNFSVTDFIPVSEGELIYFKSKRTDNAFYAFDARFLCAYDSSKNAVSASGGAFVGGQYTVPSGIAYIRLSISNSYLSEWSDFYIGTVSVSITSYVPYEYVVKMPTSVTNQISENTANIATNASNISANESAIAKNTASIESITEPTSNRFDPNSVTVGKYITSDGTITPLSELNITDYIPVTAGETINIWALVNGSYQAVPSRTRCCFDSSKTPIQAEGYDSETYGSYTVGSNVAFVRYTLRDSALEYDRLYIGTNAVGVNYVDYGKRVKSTYVAEPTYTVSNGGSILEGVMHCYANGIKKMIVEAGTYDIIAEYEEHYGSDYFSEYENYNTSDPFDRGIWLENIEVDFTAGAKVVCKYTGENANVPLYFSAFATGNNVTIDGLILDSENLRYGIHADYNSGAKQTFFIVRNSDLRHYKSATSNQAIGAGLGRHVFWLIENTIFRSDVNHICFRIHNNVNSDAQSKVIVKDCYIVGDGYFQFNAYSTSELQTMIQVCGCSYETAPVLGKETIESNENFTMIAWNNEIRA